MGGGVANDKSADQPAPFVCLISAFIIGILESIVSRLAQSQILIFYLAMETGLSLILSETPKTGLVSSRTNVMCEYSYHSLFLSSLSVIYRIMVSVTLK